MVYFAAVTPDGQRVITGLWNDGTTRLWDITTGQELLPRLSESTGSVSSGALTRDGERLVVGRTDGKATVWEMASGRPLLSLNGHIEMITSIAITPDGLRIFTGSVDGTVRVWDAVSGHELLTLNAHTGPVWSVALTPDGRQLVTGNEDGTVKIWEAATQEQVERWNRQEQEAERRLAARRPPVASAPGFIRDWLVLGPLVLQPGETWFKVLKREPLAVVAWSGDHATTGGDHATKRWPRAGHHERVDGQEYTWKKYHGEAPILDFYRFVGGPSEPGLVYAVCYVISDRERPDLRLQVGSSRLARVYLNGQDLDFSIQHLGSLWAMDEIGPITLHEGTNTLVLKVGIHHNGQGCARFVDAEGNPVQGLRVSLTPE
jgi:hypothetical protein